jgi:DNA-binding beta-propeller fold protein YncE
MVGHRLTIVTGPAAGAAIDVDDEVVVGRDAPGLGSLEGDPELSRQHARFRLLGTGAVQVEDLGSTNGTFVNGQRIAQPHVLVRGDQVRVGRSTLRLEGAPSARETVQLAALPRPVAAAPAPAPTAAPAGSSSTGPARWLRAVVALALVAAAAAGGFAVGNRGRDSSSPAARASAPATPAATAAAAALGTVYIETNATGAEGNAVLAYQYGPGGDLHPLRIASYPTGGTGSRDLTGSGALDADQHLVFSPTKRLLFAVNQGSDSVAVFHVAQDGVLTAVKGSPFPSGGKAPASVGLSGDTLVVVNKAQDGIRDLSDVAPTYTTFTVRADGSLAATGTAFRAPPGNSPTQALIAGDGKVVISTEEAGPLRAFVLGTGGRLVQGPNSPQNPPDAIYPRGFDPKRKWALGLGVHPTLHVVYAQMATINKMAVYRYDEAGRLTFVKVVPNNGGELPCWTVLNKDGSRLYTDNAGNNTMTVYDTSDALNPRQLQVLRLKHEGNPWDMRLDPTGKYIFMVDPRAGTSVKPGQGQEIHSLAVAADGTLSEPTSPAPIPVRLGVSPLGVAVVGRG